VDVCGWVEWGICVVGLLASMVVNTWPPTPWDEPSARGSLTGLYLGDISWRFFELTRMVGANLGIQLSGANELQ
jgi:hypothetical protein